MARVRDVLGLMGLAFVMGATFGYRLGPAGTPAPTVRMSGSLAVLEAFKNSESSRYCFEFDRPLASASAADLKPFIHLEPEVPTLVVESSGRDLCLAGFVRGDAYKLELLSGLLGADGTTLLKPETRDITFGKLPPRVSLASRGFILPRVGAIGLPIETINLDKLHVRIVRIADRDLVEEMAATWWRGPLSDNQKGRFSQAATVVWEGSLAVADGRQDTTVTTSLPLSEVLPNRLPGAYLVEVAPWSTAEAQRYWDSNQQWANQWVIDTDITLTTFRGDQGMVAVARSLDSAKALPGIDLALFDEDGGELARARTDASGKASFPSGALRGQGAKSPRAILAFGGDGDFSVHDVTRPAFDLSDRGVAGRPAPGPIDSFAWTDRGIYRPGETIHLSILMRDRLAKAMDAPIRVSIRRPDGSEWIERLATPDTAGGAHLSLELPATAKLGGWQAEIRSDPSAPPTGRISFEVQDFVPRTLAVTANARAPMVALGDTVSVSLHAEWLYGAPGAGLATELIGHLELAPNPFPKLKGWRFGLHDEKFEAQEISFPDETTGAEGNAELSARVETPTSSHPLQFRLEIAVFEAGGRPNPGTERVLPVQSAPVHVGLRPGFEGGRVLGGTPATIDVLTVDRAGAVVPGRRLRWQLLEEDWHYLWSREEGSWRYKTSISDHPLDSGEIESTAQPVTLSFPTKAWARYRLVVTSPDGGAPASIRFAAGWQQSEEGAEDSPDTISVIPDKDRYAVGDVAHVTVKPQFDGQTLVAVAAGTVTETREIAMSSQGAVVDIPISADWGAGTYITVNHHRPLKGEGARGPIRAVGVAWLAVDNSAKTLTVEMKAPEVLRPQTTARVPLMVKGLGKAGPAYVTLAAVDEGILAITGFETPDPDRFYFGKRRLGVDIRDDYGRLIDGRAAPAGRVRHGGDSSGARRLSVTPTRTVALFSGPLEVAADGAAVVELAIPDFSGKLRLMAVAYTPDAVGHGEASSLIRSPVVADAYLPRFLAPDDSAAMALNFNNMEGWKGPFHVEVAASGPVAVTGPAAFDLDLVKDTPRTESVQLVAKGLGIGSVTLRLTGPGGLDIQRSWPIQSRTPFFPISTEQTASLAPGESFTLPPALTDSFLPGSIRVSLGFGYLKGIDVPGLLGQLDQYPHGCTEQTTSRAMPLLFFDDPALLASTGVVPAPAELRARVQKAIDILVDRQSEDGRIGLWLRGDGMSSSWLMVFAGDFLLQAKDRGYALPEESAKRTLSWLKSFGANYTSGAATDWTRENMLSARAYALYVLARNKAPNQPAMTELTQSSQLSGLPKAMLGAALAMSGRTADADKAFASAELGLGRDDDNRALYGTKLRDLAAFLALAVESRPGFDPSAMLDRLTQLDVSADATSTQEKTWLLRAASALVRDEPINVGIQAAGQPGGTAVTRRNLLLTPTLAQIGGGYTVTNRGRQTLYRTLAVSGAPKVPLPPVAAGFKVGKQWFTLDGQPVDITSSVLTQHDRLVVSIDGKSLDGRHRQAMLVDMLPAGFQIEQLLLPSKGKEKQKDRFSWLSARSRPLLGEARDDRLVAAFDVNEPRTQFGWSFEREDDDDDTSHVQAGKDFAIAYVVRAVTPGRFVVPAAAIEDMYRPTVMARSTAGMVEIVRK